MRAPKTHRILAVVTVAAVLATMSAATVASPTSAAKFKCAGKNATIVGTRKGEIIRGTPGADVIVAMGGHDKIYAGRGDDIICGNKGNDRIYGGPGVDRIYGQLGRDELYGNPGRDILSGGPDNDTLNGGIDVDTCFQGSGTGPELHCELPVPEPPTLVIAYSDVNTNHVYDAGDVMIAKIVDTTKDGAVGDGDTIKMGQYPLSPAIITPAVLRGPFLDWRVKELPVSSADLDADVDIVTVWSSAANREFTWVRNSAGTKTDLYEETDGTHTSALVDDTDPPTDPDIVDTDIASPSQPTNTNTAVAPGLGDDGFIDVEIYVP